MDFATVDGVSCREAGMPGGSPAAVRMKSQIRRKAPSGGPAAQTSASIQPYQPESLQSDPKAFHFRGQNGLILVIPKPPVTEIKHVATC